VAGAGEPRSLVTRPGLALPDLFGGNYEATKQAPWKSYSSAVGDTYGPLISV
jgi:hypothetical protein